MGNLDSDCIGMGWTGTMVSDPVGLLDRQASLYSGKITTAKIQCLVISF